MRLVPDRMMDWTCEGAALVVCAFVCTTEEEGKKREEYKCSGGVYKRRPRLGTRPVAEMHNYHEDTCQFGTFPYSAHREVTIDDPFCSLDDRLRTEEVEPLLWGDGHSLQSSWESYYPHPMSANICHQTSTPSNIIEFNQLSDEEITSSIADACVYGKGIFTMSSLVRTGFGAVLVVVHVTTVATKTTPLKVAIRTNERRARDDGPW
ncbi:hypothetical protein AAG570_010704 [Ranatra chinensis]|uniref:Uncharacterized protein n=1 Tax=Ranatra chinensis TaxID=642074 RepID=A0ABD0YNF4_9HEMI